MHFLVRFAFLLAMFLLAVNSDDQESTTTEDKPRPAQTNRAPTTETSRITQSPDMPTSTPRRKSQKMGLKQYLKDKGRVQDIPKALVIYESLSMTFMFASLAFTYALEPTKKGIVGPLRQWTEGSWFQQLQQAAGRRLGWLGRSLNLDAVRLATAYAECTILRLFLKPILLPLKLYLTWNGLLLWKREDD